jgi:hypothetical protein
MSKMFLSLADEALWHTLLTSPPTIWARFGAEIADIVKVFCAALIRMVIGLFAQFTEEHVLGCLARRRSGICPR